LGNNGSGKEDDILLKRHDKLATYDSKLEKACGQRGGTTINVPLGRKKPAGGREEKERGRRTRL